MKALGIIRKIDSLGRVVIPMEVRRTHGWEEETPMEMFMDGESLVIRSYKADSERDDVINQLTYVKSIEKNEVAKQVMQKAIDFLEKKKA